MSAPARIAATIRRFGLARTVPSLPRLPSSLSLSRPWPRRLAPAVTIENASNPTVTTADLEGTVDPKGQLTSWRFEYVTRHRLCRKSSRTPTRPSCSPSTGPAGSTSVAKTVTGQLTGLQANTTYHLRLLAENADGQSEAIAAGTFTTRTRRAARHHLRARAGRQLKPPPSTASSTPATTSPPTGSNGAPKTAKCPPASRPPTPPPVSTRSSKSISPTTKTAKGNGISASKVRPRPTFRRTRPDRRFGSL